MSPPAPVRDLAESYAATQKQLAAKAIAVLGQIMVRGLGSPQRWRDAVAALAPRLLELQVAAALIADPYVSAVMAAQGAGGPPDGHVNGPGFVDLTDGGGSWMRLLVFAPLAVRGRAVSTGLGLARAQTWMQLVASSIVLTGLQDTRRASTQAAMFTHGAGGYVRMVQGSSCARCVVLAGRHYRSAVAFDRHPRCDCVNIPTAEDRDDWATDAAEHFRSLSPQEQDRVFTKAGAQAIRDSGGTQVAINQIVNARQGISTVTAFGRDIQVTTVGTTKRALFGGYEIRADGSLRKRADSELQKLPGNRLRTAKAPRLLPDEIYRLAQEFGWDRAEVLRQLRRFAYVL